MTRWGVGPRFAALSVLLASPVAALNALWPGGFAIHIVPRIVTMAAGGVLLAGGVVFMVTATLTLHRRFEERRLLTSGVYALCRNPIYASWTVLLVPGALLLSGSWLFLLVPLTMYAVLRRLIRREEEWLEATFGEEYVAYRKRVPAVVPLPPWRS